MSLFAALFERSTFNYFDNSTKLLSDLHLAKFLDISVKSFFLCVSEKKDHVV